MNKGIFVIFLWGKEIQLDLFYKDEGKRLRIKLRKVPKDYLQKVAVVRHFQSMIYSN